MARVCKVCGKSTVFGGSISRSGLAKKKGGIGQHITKVSPRKFYPNLQKVKAKIKGTVRTIKVCTRCIKSNKIQKV